jgi:hypothetical protein
MKVLKNDVSGHSGMSHDMPFSQLTKMVFYFLNLLLSIIMAELPWSTKKVFGRLTPIFWGKLAVR